jgi:hypothetical protein
MNYYELLFLDKRWGDAKRRKYDMIRNGRVDAAIDAERECSAIEDIYIRRNVKCK